LGLAAYFVAAYLKGAASPVEKLGEAHAGKVLRPAPPADPFAEATTQYLTEVIKDYSQLKFRGLKTRARQIETPTLEQAYISVHMAAETRRDKQADKEGLREGRLSEPVEALDLAGALKLTRKLAVIGAAGSGKSTLLQWAGLSAACAMLQKPLRPEPQAIMEALHAPLLPALLPLREFNRYCLENQQPRTAHQLFNYLAVYARETYHLTLPEGFFERHLQQGCLLMFDGVDEVAGEDRKFVREAIEDLLSSVCAANPRNREDESVQLPSNLASDEFRDLRTLVRAAIRDITALRGG